MTTRENILAAVATALSEVVEGRVYRSRKEQLPALPAVVITPSSQAVEEVVLGKADATLDVDVAVYARGDTPDTAADSVLDAAHAALMADLTLGLGSEVQILPAYTVRWDFDSFDETRVVSRYRVAYRTTLGGS